MFGFLTLHGLISLCFTCPGLLMVNLCSCYTAAHVQCSACETRVHTVIHMSWTASCHSLLPSVPQLDGVCINCFTTSAVQMQLICCPLSCAIQDL